MVQVRVVLKKFVVETRDWPEQKSSESTEQFFVTRTLLIWFVKVIGQFCIEVAVRLKLGFSSVDSSVLISR